MTIEIDGEAIDLLPERAFWWKRAGILGLSDVHLGKASSLQARGLPVPSTDISDLRRLGGLVFEKQARAVFILGDWVHDRASWSPSLVRELEVFFSEFPNVEWTLILGNHERGSKEHLRGYPMRVIRDHFAVGPFRFSHGHQLAPTDRFCIQGHVHPVVTLRDGPVRMRLPCFFKRDRTLILPSFGELTGGYELERTPIDQVFAVTSSDVFEVPGSRREGGK